MPELPEVETVRRGLSPKMQGRQFTHVHLNRPDLRFPFPDRFTQRLEGHELVSMKRRAKFLMCELSSGETLLMHLGMSGRFSIEDGTHDKTWPTDSGAANPKHDHVVFTMSAVEPGEQPPRIIYNDPRRFGFMELLEAGDLGRMADLGPEPLSNAFNGPVLQTALARKKAPIKSTLLDQRIVAGLGNIYVCEALYRSRITPTRLSCELDDQECELLVTEIKKTLEEAIRSGGSTLKDFAATDGALGYFQHRFQVYGKEGTPCTHKSCTGEISRIKQSGRSTFYCPICQI